MACWTLNNMTIKNLYKQLEDTTLDKFEIANIEITLEQYQKAEKIYQNFAERVLSKEEQELPPNNFNTYLIGIIVLFVILIFKN